MNRWKMFWTAGAAAVLGLSVWQNRRLYQKRGWVWIGIKSMADTGLALVLAFRMPALLCAYVILWLTRPLKGKPVFRTTFTTGLAVAMSLAANRALEVVVLIGVLAMDLVSGGVWRYWQGIGAETLDWKQELGIRKLQRKAA